MTWPARHVSQTIDRPPGEVYAFISNPENLTRWASGLAQSALARHGDAWTASSPMGDITIRFAPANDFGIVDHDVTLPNGEVVANHLRVLPNDTGSEVVFTLFHRPGMSEAEFVKDAQTIAQDLATLKTLLE